MIKKIPTILSVFIFLGLYSCDKSAFLDQGYIVTEMRLLDSFRKIEVYDIFNIFLVQDTIPKIIITGGENLLPHVTTYVRDDTLFINNDSGYRWSRAYNRINIYINVDQSLDKVTLNSASNLQTIDTISGGNLTIWAIGDLAEIDITINYDYFYFADARTSTGKFIFRGIAESAMIWGRGSCHIMAGELLVNHLHIRNSSIGNCYVYAIDELKYEIENTGNIYYTNTPDNIIKLPSTSSGLLIQE